MWNSHRQNSLRYITRSIFSAMARASFAKCSNISATTGVGPTTLGRMFNVIGDPIDQGAPVKPEKYYPIHRPAPSYEEQVTTPQFFETGMKVIDLVAPFIKGGKVGVFRGPGAAKKANRRTHGL